jgi:multiple sugar transport system substrate-binding protein
MLEPQILTPWIAEEIYLPTQISLGEGNGSYANFLRKSIPFYDDMISMIPWAKVDRAFQNIRLLLRIYEKL